MGIVARGSEGLSSQSRWPREAQRGCLVNSIFMGRGAPWEHESFVANFHLR
jgi:hypothetical protein